MHVAVMAGIEEENVAGEIPGPVGEEATEMAHANRKIPHLYV